MFNISIVNRQIIDGRRDTVRESSEGSLYVRDGKTYIIYKTENGSEACTIIAGDTVTVKRHGETASVMKFDKLRRTRTLYSMPYGKMLMEIETEKIVNALSEDGGRLRLVYTITVQGQKIYNDMSIVVG